MTTAEDLIKALRHAAVNGPAVVTPEMLNEAADLIERLTAESSLASIRALQDQELEDDTRVEDSQYGVQPDTAMDGQE